MKIIVAAIGALLLAGVLMHVFSTKTFAAETETESKISTESSVLVDRSGNVISSEIKVTNSGNNEITITKIDAPDGFDNWNVDIIDKKLKGNSELEGEWTGEKVSNEIVNKLKNDEEIELQFSLEVTSDITYDLTSVKVSADTSDRVYAGMQFKPEVEIEDLVEGEDFEVEYGENFNAGEDVGTITVKGIGFWEGEQTLTFNILKKQITVNWSDLVFSYDAQAHKPSASANGLCGDDSVSITVSDEQTNAGTYTAIATIDDVNYEFGSEQSTSWTINKKSITANVEAVAKNRIYDATTNVDITSITATFNTLAGSDALEIDSYTAALKKKDAGEQPVVLSNIKFKGASLANYDITSTTQSDCKATITAKEITVSGLSAKERIYAEDDTSVTLTGTAAFGTNDICSGDSVTIGTITGAYANADAADNKDVTLTIPLSGTDVANYKISDASKTIKGNILAIVKFEPNTTVSETIAEKNPHNQTTIADDVTAKLPTRTGLKVAGWYDNAACDGTAWNFATSKVTENVTTLYARWVAGDDADEDNMSYWIAPSMKITTGNSTDKTNKENPDYVSEDWNIIKTAEEIQADVKKIKQGDATTIAEYTKFMNEDNYHLYTKYGNGDGTSKDDFAEFRIIEVSGANGHETTTADGDGSVITFMATHTLPSTSKMAEATNKDGWPSSNVYAQFQPNTGEIFNKFSSSFTDDITEVKKEWVHGNTSSQTETPIISNDRFWLLSYSEIIDSTASNYFSEASKNEGTRYEWFKNLGVSTSNNPALSYLTRSGSNPAGGSGNAYWWLRSSNILAYTYFLTANCDGLVRDGNGRLENSNSIVPCFSFGVNRTVKFDNQGHENAISTQYDEVGSKVTEPTATEIGTADGLTFEGWYTDSKCSADKKWNFSTNTVSDHMTLYANWIPDSTTENEYWLAPAMKTTTANTSDAANQANSNYVSPTNNVKKAADEIQADVKKISEGDATTIAEYTKYMTEDNIHLYTKYTDANSKGSEDNYAEFRIIEVGNHDGKEALTFQATHVLPTASRQIVSSNIVPTWDKTELAERMNSGDIFKSFSTRLTDDTMNVTKTSAIVNKDNTTSASYKLWLPSYVELSGGFKTTEGSQYGYYKQIGVTYGADNPALAFMTREGNVCTDTAYSDNRWWTRSSPDATRESNTTYMIANPYAAGALQVWAHYYAYNAAGIAPCFAFGMERTVTFDNCGHGNSVSAQNVTIGDIVTSPDAGTVEGLTLEGWYTDPKYTAASKWDFSTNTVSNHTTLYANWVTNTEESAYWMAPAMTSSNYVSETQNVLKTASDIQADVVKLQAGDATVTAEYEGYMNNNSYHLYTKWNGSGNTGKNAYVEFQIVSVGKHYNIADDETSADGSCITFMASYLLPGTYQMKASGSNNGGWPSSDTTLRISMNEGGDIYSNFDSKFTSDISPTLKRSQTTLSSVSPTQWGITSDKLWVPSFNEFTGRSADNCSGEGTGYSNVPNAVMKTREGSGNTWWLRTIKPDNAAWCVTYSHGFVGGYQMAGSDYGVLPCFSFGASVYKE